jgi:hypothetical protein
LWFEPQPLEWDGAMAIDAQAIFGTMNTLQGASHSIELATLNVRDDTVDLMFTSALSGVICILQNRLVRRLGLGKSIQLGGAILLQACQPGLQ